MSHGSPVAERADAPTVPDPVAADAVPSGDGGRSRATALVRLVAAVWLLWSAGRTLADPPAGAAERGAPIDAWLPLAGLYFSVGMFLLSGFMSRLSGLALLGLAAWEWFRIGPAAAPTVLGLVGIYLALRGGGAWAMDRYVGHMQDRVRQREAREALVRERDQAP